MIKFTNHCFEGFDSRLQVADSQDDLVVWKLDLDLEDAGSNSYSAMMPPWANHYLSASLPPGLL